MKRKGGFPQSAVPQVIVFVLVFLVSVTAMLGFTGFTGTTAAESQDKEQLTKLHSEIEKKCDTGVSASDSVVSTSVTVEFSFYDEIRVNDDGNLVAESSEGGTEEKELMGCDYSFSGFPAQADESKRWTFEISHEGDSYPPKIGVEASS